MLPRSFFRRALSACLLLAAAPLQAAAAVELSIGDRGGPWLLLEEAKAAAPEVSKVRSLAEPRTLAAGDLDGDGMPDLAVGLATATGGRVVIYPGNVDHLFPNEPEAQARRAAGTGVAEAFLPASAAIELAGAPDFLAIGDVDADGAADLVSATLGAEALEIAPGDGHGAFGERRRLPTGGAITAFAAGEVDQRDRLVDLAIAVERAGRGTVLVLAGPQGAENADRERLPIASPARALLLDTLDGDSSHDLAVATAGEVELFFGLGQVPAATAAERGRAALGARLPFSAKALAGGDFARDDGDYRRELALLDARGDLTVLRLGRDAGGLTHESVAGLAAVADDRATQLVPAHLNAAGREQVVVLSRGAAARIAQPELPALKSFAGRELVELTGSAEPVAALALRLNVDPFADLVLLVAGSAEPVVLETKSASTFVVNSADDEPDCNQADGVCSTDAGGGCGSGGCTLRAAIEQANHASSPGADLIQFAIGTSGSTHLINTESPPIVESLTLDATTQPGYAGVPLIHASYWLANWATFNFQNASYTVRGFGVTGPSGGFHFQSGNSNSFVESNRLGPALSQPAVNLDLFMHGGSSTVTVGGAAAPARNYFFGDTNAFANVSGTGHVIRNNWFGLDPAGTFASTDQDLAVFSGVSSASLIDNVISGSTNAVFQRSDIVINGGNGFVIQGNLVGTDATGNASVGNIGWGLMASDPSNLTIGGSAPGQGNVFSGHGQHGVLLSTAAGGNVFRGNKVGVGADGITALGNGLAGIRVGHASTTSIAVGGVGAGEGNLIANNGGAGVLVQDGWNHRIRGNSIFDNGGIAIDLTSQGNGAGVSPNDAGDADGGDWSGHGNQYQNFPVLTEANHDAVAGTLNSAASATFDLDFYVTPTCDAEGNGEAKTYLGSKQVTTDGAGNATFTAHVSRFVDGQVVTATATDPSGNTSELSACQIAFSDPIFADGFESGNTSAWSAP